jgi:hypothetical protein
VPDDVAGLVGWLLPIFGVLFVHDPPRMKWTSLAFALAVILTVAWRKGLFVAGSASSSWATRVLDGWGSWPVRAWTLSIMALGALVFVESTISRHRMDVEDVLLPVHMSALPIAVACVDDHWLWYGAQHSPRRLAQWRPWLQGASGGLALIYLGLLVVYVQRLAVSYDFSWTIPTYVKELPDTAGGIVVWLATIVACLAIIVVCLAIYGPGTFGLFVSLGPLLYAVVALPVLFPWYVAALLRWHAQTGATLGNSLLRQLFWIFAVAYGVDEIHPQGGHHMTAWLSTRVWEVTVAGGLLALVVLQSERQRIQIRELGTERAGSSAKQ